MTGHKLSILNKTNNLNNPEIPQGRIGLNGVEFDQLSRVDNPLFAYVAKLLKASMALSSLHQMLGVAIRMTP